MKLDLRRKTAAIFGYKEGGKSTLAKTLAASYGEEALYYDTLHEIPKEAPFFAYKPKITSDVGELETIITLVERSKKFRMFFIDEANRFCPPKPKPLPPKVQDLNDWCRHPQYNVGVVYVARRPVQLNSDLTEICDYLIIFQLGGKNDIDYLNSMARGLGDAVESLNKWEFVIAPNKRSDFKKFNPITPNKIFINSDTTRLKGGKY